MKLWDADSGKQMFSLPGVLAVAFSGNGRFLASASWRSLQPGEATVWESRLATGDEDRLVDQFVSNVEPAFREILAGMRAKDADLAALSRRYQQIKSQDYFNSELGQRVREALIAAKGGPK